MLRRFLLALLLTGISPAFAAGALTVVGSDLLREALEPVLAKPGSEPESTLQLRLEGSYSGMKDLRAGKADLAVATFGPNEPLPTAEFRLVPLAYQVVVVAVTATNPMRQLSYAQLAGVFGEKETGNFRQWGALGATDFWQDKTVATNTVHSPDTLALDLFRFTVLQVPVLRTTMAIHASFDELLMRVRLDDNSIGLFPCLLPDTTGVTVLSVSREDKDVAFGPTPENIHTGDYPLRLPFFIVFKAERAAELSSVVDTLLGDEAAVGLSKLGFVPVPVNARREAQRVLTTK